MQSSPLGQFKYIMVYQCHLTKFAGINRTSYRVMFKEDPKVELTSSSLPPEILERLQSEDDLLPLHQAPLLAITEPTSAHNNEPPPAPNETLPPSPPASLLQAPRLPQCSIMTFLLHWILYPWQAASRHHQSMKKSMWIPVITGRKDS